jgi:hypothetical protein
MPLHVNLYHEIQRQERNRKRDPLRLAAMGLSAIAAGFVLYYLVALGQTHEVTSKFADVQSQFAGLDPKAKAAKAREDELNQQISASTDLQSEVDNRFYWAPVMGQILSAVPRTVQVTRFVATGVADGKSEGNIITLIGVASGPEPRKDAEALRTSLISHLGTQYTGVTAVFKTLEDSDELVLLDSRRLSTALFTIEIQVKDRIPTPVAVVAPAKAKMIAAK